MNSLIFTDRPSMSTIAISADRQGNSRQLDELLAASNGSRLSLVSSVINTSSSWFSQSSCLGLDDNKNLMYSLTRSEIGLFTTVAIAGLTVLGSLLNWLFI
ncbi:hypothetical protein [Spirosoma flavum]|uniref:Uncharacterized protein n=1 Tax=Spirosoma flavum TaxID=2048557 RepID=A0ABW6AH69_9BACT